MNLLPILLQMEEDLKEGLRISLQPLEPLKSYKNIIDFSTYHLYQEKSLHFGLCALAREYCNRKEGILFDKLLKPYLKKKTFLCPCPSDLLKITIWSEDDILTNKKTIPQAFRYRLSILRKIKKDYINLKP